MARGMRHVYVCVCVFLYDLVFVPHRQQKYVMLVYVAPRLPPSTTTTTTGWALLTFCTLTLTLCLMPYPLTHDLSLYRAPSLALSRSLYAAAQCGALHQPVAGRGVYWASSHENVPISHFIKHKHTQTHIKHTHSHTHTHLRARFCNGQNVLMHQA